MRPLVLLLALGLTACSSGPRVRFDGEVYLADPTKSSAKPGIYLRAAAPPDATALEPVDKPAVRLSPRTKLAFKDHGSSLTAKVEGSTFHVSFELTNGGRTVYDRFVDVRLDVEAPGHTRAQATFVVPQGELRFDRELIVVLARATPGPVAPLDKR